MDREGNGEEAAKGCIQERHNHILSMIPGFATRGVSRLPRGYPRPEGGAMFGLGFGELIVVLVIVVLLFNRRLPDLGESLGKSIRKFRKAANDTDEIDITPKDDSRKPSS
jgi:sec-independent protein translocase protein TatA